MNSRVRFLIFSFLLGFFLVWLQLLRIQIFDFGKYQALARNQHWRTLEIPARRGRLISHDGFILVDNKTTYLLYGHPQEVADERELSQDLAKILFDENLYSDQERKLGLTNLRLKFAKSLEEKMSNKELFWIGLYHKVSPEQKEKIEKLKVPGLGFEEEPERFYPEKNLASHLLGFVGVDNLGREKGYYGLEGYYNGDLKGETGRISQELTAEGHPILLAGFNQTPSHDGRDLYLTINRSIQFLVEEGLGRGVKKYGAKGGTIIVMEPDSGSILAMASYPNYDPASWLALTKGTRNLGDSKETTSEENKPSFRDPAISETYEPGSVLKAVTISAGIATETVSPQTTFEDAGPILVSGYVIDNWNKKHLGLQTMVEVLQKSNNMGAAFVAQKLGKEKLREYFLKFGLGNKLGIDLEGEESGLVKKSSDFSDVDLVTNSFGQGIAVTPLQLTTDFAAIANGGTLYKPYVLEKIKEGSQEIKFGKQAVRQVLTPAKAKVMVEMLTAAAEGGEAKFFVLKKYHVAGKTGTAQIPKSGRYDEKKTNATFVGFLPNSNKFVMLVKLSQPVSSIYAAETAVPLWMDLTQELVTYFGIPPDR